jgi:diaminopimelate decarboxylase
MNIDCVRESIALPPMTAGDLLLIRPVGAYTFTQSMQFIHLRPACVLVAEDGHVDLIRRSEIIEDLIAAEIVPDRLTAARALAPSSRQPAAVRNFDSVVGG